MLDLVHHRTGRTVEAYVDGELYKPERRWEIEAHLRACSGCQREVRTLRRIKRSLRCLGRRRPTSLSTARLHRWADRLIHERG